MIGVDDAKVTQGKSCNKVVEKNKKENKRDTKVTQGKSCNKVVEKNKKKNKTKPKWRG